MYRQCPPKRVKEARMNEIYTVSRVRSIMHVTLELKIERGKWVTSIIFWVVDNGVHMYIYKIHYTINEYTTSHVFVYDSHFKPLGFKNVVGLSLIT